MDNYLNSYREMISLRGLTHHTVTSYSTYISAYLDYLSVFLCKDPQDVSGRNSAILSAGYRKPVPFRTGP